MTSRRAHGRFCTCLCIVEYILRKGVACELLVKMPSGRKKRPILFSKLYSFSCFEARLSQEHGQIGKRGYSRVVYCDDLDNEEAFQLNYRSNYVSTTKYTAWNFFPKSLFEQFRRVANLYFLAQACFSFTSVSPFSPISIVAPLVVVIGATMIKEAVEDWKRKKQDIEANNRRVEVFDKESGTFIVARWKNLRVGDVVKIHKDEYFPADLILVSSSYYDGICYVETANLDGETNLKLKHSLDVTSSLHVEDSFRKFKAVIKCEDPNEYLYSFVGTLFYNDQELPLSLQQFLLRDSKLRNTDHVFGVVVFTGNDTKVMQNTTDPPSKRSKIERKMDKIIYILFSVLIFMSIVGSIFFLVSQMKDIHPQRYRRWYLWADRNDNKSAFGFILAHFVTALMLYGYLIPISLYVSIEIVKVLQSIFINQDQDMYDEETDTPARARTSNLNEELGQVHTILSDKTGTLTRNSMEFIKCYIAGTAYGRGMTEVERAMAGGEGNSQPQTSDADNVQSESLIKGFNFRDERIMNGQWVYQPYSDFIQKFFRVLAICHTAIPDVNNKTGEIFYEAESPDEAAFVIAARELGFKFFERTQTNISLHELDNESGEKVNRSYELLHVLEFSSARKRMSVIVRNPENQILLLCKGADSVMFERLSEQGRVFEADAREHAERYAEAGLRTLAVAYRELDEEEYKQWEKEFLLAKTSVSEDRDALVDAAADKIERDLILLGVTAVEDKLQEGVPECIDKLAKAQMKIWVLTGDKMETAINIGYACNLLRQEMRQIVITLDLPEIIASEKHQDREGAEKASSESVGKQIRDGVAELESENEDGVTFGLIIDGKSLAFALSKYQQLFLGLATRCSTVICCRSSPKQKALVARMLKMGKGKITLAIGDGANDVGMLQEADIGVGISGVEGRQAVMSSDFAISQFRFLERLLLVHGHWCYRRIAMMICYFFYKNVAFGFTLFWYEAYASFSGQPAYNDWYMSFYNVLFTSLPVIALGVLDQDVSARLCLVHPLLYQEGVQNILFSWPRILGWMLNGVLSSIIIFFSVAYSTMPQAFRKDGQVVDYQVLGATLYTCVVWTVNCQIALSINYFTWLQHIVIWGSIALWYLFLLIFGYFPSVESTTGFRVFVEACAPSPFYWGITILVVVSALLPYFLFRAFQTRFRPMQHDIIQLASRRESSMRC